MRCFVSRNRRILAIWTGIRSAPCGAVTADELRARLKRFAIRIVNYVQTLPKAMEAQEIGRQLVRAGTGVSANYHAAGRARSRKEFIAVLVQRDAAEQVEIGEHLPGAEYDRRQGIFGQLNR